MPAPDTRRIPKDVCCICGEQPVKCLDEFGYPFCAGCDHRYHLLQIGRQYSWPALRYDGYALDGDMQAYLLTVICGTDERVFALLEALGELEEAA